MQSVYDNAELHYFSNPGCTPGGYPEELKDILDADTAAAAREEIARWAGYRPTPLHRLDAVARDAGVDAVYYKDEGERFPPGSFKALGGAYAVERLLCEQIGCRIGVDVSLEDIRTVRYPDAAAAITVATATDGNHGRSVAWGAQRFGCRCTIYIHREVSEGRKAAMEAYGARVTRVDGNYDDSVRRAQSDAAANGWFIVSDTSYPGYTTLPRYVMAGYTLMMQEVFDQLDDPGALTHVFLQGGCGGLAASVAAYLWQVRGAGQPRLVVVEPVQADCLYRSASAGRRVDVNITEESLMAGLSCGEVSTLAWTVVHRAVHDFITLNDELIGPTMTLLARGTPPIVAGESAVPGLAALLAASRRETLRRTLGLASASRILLLGTEGATDPGIYRELVGMAPRAVRATSRGS